jgi:hypothetical protein
MPDEDAPYHQIDAGTEVTAPHDDNALFVTMQTDPALVAEKILHCIELVETQHKRMLALEARHKALRGDHTALLLRVDELAVRFDTITGALQARQPP